MDRVVADLWERKRIGIERYGTPLQPFNGRDALVDLYQELLDAVMYVRQEIEERRSSPPARVLEDLWIKIHYGIAEHHSVMPGGRWMNECTDDPCPAIRTALGVRWIPREYIPPPADT